MGGKFDLTSLVFIHRMHLVKKKNVVFFSKFWLLILQDNLFRADRPTLHSQSTEINVNLFSIIQYNRFWCLACRPDVRITDVPAEVFHRC